MFESDCEEIYRDLTKRELKICLKSLRSRYEMDSSDELYYHIKYLENRIMFAKGLRLEKYRNILIEKADIGTLILAFGGVLLICMLTFLKNN